MPNSIAGVMPGRRKVATALVATMLLFALYLSQGMNANAATYTYNASSDVCFSGSLVVNANVGDTVNVSFSDFDSCWPDNLSPWTTLWPDTTEEYVGGGNWLITVPITQTGSATVWFDGGLASMTINAAATVPGAPTNVSATAGNAQATVSFDAPADNGGSAITGYTVTSSPGGLTASGASSPLTVTGLTNGTSYTFTVTATNANGTGPASSASNAVTPATVPGAPTNVSAMGSDAEAFVYFDAPNDDGGSAITGYTATSSPGGLTGTGVTSPITVTGLTNGIEYTFTVTATNGVGTGPASAASDIAYLVGIPGAPTTVTAVAGNGQATISFDAPADTGGYPISEYRVTSNPLGPPTATGTSSPIIVTGLTNGTEYTFRVTASNWAYTSEYSSWSNAVTPATVPGAPGTPIAVAGDTSAVVYFAPPADNGGSAITGYTVTSTPGGLTGTGESGPIAVEGLTNGTSYTFTVTATNNVGTGEPSLASNAVTPATVPDAPVHVTATAGNGQATITFDAPADNGGSAISRYWVTVSPGGAFYATTTSPVVIDGLTNGVEYTFAVTAENGRGVSPSAVSNAVTPLHGTHITLNTSPGTSIFGNGFALVANVSGEGTPTGTVVFLRNGEEIGSAALDANGDATLAIDAGYAVGAHTFRAVYSGSAAYESAESNIATHTVAKATSTLALTVSHNHLLVGETITLTATVPMDVTGTVTFTANGKSLGSASIVDGKATLEALFAVAGDQEVVATSSGDASYLGATDSLTVTVHTVAAGTMPPTGTPSETPSETPTPGETPDPTETPDVPTNPETPATGTPDNEPTNEPTSGLVESAPTGTTAIKVSNPEDFKVGDVIVINEGTPNEERRTIVAIDERGIVLNAGLDFTHEAGVSVVLAAGTQPVVPPATEPTAQPGAPLPPNSGSGLRIIDTGPLFALPLVLAVLLLASGAVAYGTRKQS